MAEPCEVWFYHLERTSLSQALPELLEKTLARGWKALVRTPSPERIGPLDDLLWTYREESFLPHGAAGEPNAARQPILLTNGLENANGAQALFLIDGAETGPLDGYTRCIVMFDGADHEQLTAARTQWVAVRKLGLPMSYWKQTPRGWEKQAL